jgi:hypothetical protein
MGISGDFFRPDQPGINADLTMDLVSGYTFIVLSNHDHPTAVTITEEIMKIYGLK